MVNSRQTGAAAGGRVLVARKTIAFIVGYFLYIPLVFGILALGVLWADRYVDTSNNPIPGWLMVLLLCLIIGGPVLIFCVVWNRPAKWEAQLQRSGTRALAVITNVADTGVSTNGGRTIYVRLTLNVQPEGAAAFVATLETANSRVAFMRAGETLSVLYDPSNPKHIVIADDSSNAGATTVDSAPPVDTTLNLLTLRPEYTNQLEGIARGRAAGSVWGGDLASQLATLDQLHRNGALTAAEYAAAKARLLG